MFYRTLFPRDLFAEFDRLQRAMQRPDGYTPSIRGSGHGAFPAMNVGSTPASVEVYAFAPGLDPASIEIQLEKGVLTVAGERRIDYAPQDDKAAVHIDERFAGRFRRVVSLPDDIDADNVHAKYRNGVLHVSIPRRAATQPRRISIQ